MELIPVLLLLSNCKTLLRENIELLLIKSNYIFFLHSVYPEILQCCTVSPLCEQYNFLFNIIKKYDTVIVIY